MDVVSVERCRVVSVMSSHASTDTNGTDVTECQAVYVTSSHASTDTTARDVTDESTDPGGGVSF